MLRIAATVFALTLSWQALVGVSLTNGFDTTLLP